MYYYYYSIGVVGIFLSSILSVGGDRDLFEKKCKRECNTQHGTLKCWQTTTEGFAYGLSTAMIEYCQVILQLRQSTVNPIYWYNTSREILIRQIDAMNFDRGVRQLTKTDVQQVATSLLDQCFSALSSSTQPSCPSCSKNQTKLIRQWSLVTYILLGICVLLLVMILCLYGFASTSTRPLYHAIG